MDPYNSGTLSSSQYNSRQHRYPSASTSTTGRGVPISDGNISQYDLQDKQNKYYSGGYDHTRQEYATYEKARGDDNYSSQRLESRDATQRTEYVPSQSYSSQDYSRTFQDQPVNSHGSFQDSGSLRKSSSQPYSSPYGTEGATSYYSSSHSRLSESAKMSEGNYDAMSSYDALRSSQSKHPLASQNIPVDSMRSSVETRSSLDTRSSMGETDLRMAMAANATPDEEIKRLRTALATTTAELGRQIEKFSIENRSGDHARVDWLQKLLVQMEGRLAIVDSELKESQKREKDVQGKLAKAQEFEVQNNMLRELQKKLIREQQATQQKARQQQQDNSGTLEAAENNIKQLTSEKNQMNKQLDELMHRHTILQRSLQKMDETKNHDVEALTRIQERLKETEGRAQALVHQNVALVEERDEVRQTLSNELKSGEHRSAALQQQNEMMIAKLKKDLKDAQLEVLNEKKKFVQLQVENDSQMSSVSAKLSAENTVTLNRLYEVEHRHVIAAKQLTETEDKCRWLSEQLRTFESNRFDVQTAHQAELDRCSEKSHNMAAFALKRFVLERCFTRWSEVSAHNQERLARLHSVFKTLDLRWHRRFYKNHFMAWRYNHMQGKKGLLEMKMSLQAESLKDVLMDWAALAREARLSRTTEAATSQCEEKMAVKHTQALQELQKKHDSVLNQFIEKHSRELQSALQTHAVEVEQVRAKMRAEMSEAADKHQARVEEVEHLFKELKQKHALDLGVAKAKCSSDKKEMQEEHATALSVALAQHTSDMKEIKEKNDTQVEHLSAELAGAQALVARMSADHAAQIFKTDVEHADALEQLKKQHSDAENSLRDQLRALEQDCTDRVDEAKTFADVQIAAAKREFEERIAGVEEDCKSKISTEKQQHQDAIAALKKESELNIEQIHQNAENEKTKFEAEKETLTTRMEELQIAHLEVEASLREQMVQGNRSKDESLEEFRAEKAKKEEELRKKLIEREKDIAAHLELAEKERQQAVEEAEKERHDLQTDCAAKLERMRLGNIKSQEELRQKMINREKELNSKLENLRSENIKAQESFQIDLQEKEAESKAKLAQKEKDFKTHLDSLISSRESSSVKDLTAKTIKLETALEKAQDDIQEAIAREKEACVRERKVNVELDELRMELGRVQSQNAKASQEVEAVRSVETQLMSQYSEKKAEVADLLKREKQVTQTLHETNALLNESQTLQQSLIKQIETCTQELETHKAKTERQEELVAQSEKELKKALAEKHKIASDLKVATQQLLKRGDDFSESARLLQGRFEASDFECKELQEKLKSAQATNIRLAKELEDVSLSMTKKGDTSTVEMYKARLTAMEQELNSVQRQWQERLSTAHNTALVSNSELTDALASAESELQAAQVRVIEAEEKAAWLNDQLKRGGGGHGGAQMTGEVEAMVLEIRKRLERTERENDTLTNELDNCLAENAELRQELDNLRDLKDEQAMLIDDNTDSCSAASSCGLSRLNCMRDSFRSDHTRSIPTTFGVHTIRLLRKAFMAWTRVTVEQRMVGKSPMFSGLDYFIGQDGSLAEWMPVGRIRRNELVVNHEKLGSGSFAEVMKGEWKLTVAVKKMKGSIQHKELLEFVREGEMLRNLSHPCIVKLLGIYQEGGTYSLVQECVTGVNIFDYLHKFQKTIPVGKQLGIALQMCDALAYVHDMRIVHRDVKPQNVIYQEKTGIVKLCDFGLARLMPLGVSELHPSQLGTGGTPAYQAPEVLKRQAVGRKLDQYGFSITLWEIYTTKLPWSECNLDQMTAKVALKDERPPLPADMPVEYAEIIKCCWKTDPARRPDFCDIITSLRDMHATLNPSSKITASYSSLASTVSSISTKSACSKTSSHMQRPAQLQRIGSGASVSSSGSSAMNTPTAHHTPTARGGMSQAYSYAGAM